MNIFKTRNTDVATFLLYLGEDLIKVEDGGGVVFMTFSDPLGRCSDLERVYLNSECKKFKDLNKWLLGRIHDVLGRK